MLAFTKSLSMRRAGTLLVLATFVGGLLFKGIKVKRTPAPSNFYVPGYPSYSGSTIPGAGAGNDSDSRSLEIEITGYWKEVRTSLGLPPLRDSVVFPTDMNLRLDDSTEALGHVSVEDKRHLRRLGRLNPGLRRRRLVFDPSNSVSRSREQPDVTQEGSEQAKDNTLAGTRLRLLLDAESMRGYSFADASPLDLVSVPPSDTFPDLFIASDTHRPPQTPVGALAASFRAIAMKELRAHRRGPYLNHVFR